MVVSVCSIHELEQSEKDRYNILVPIKPLEIQYEGYKKDLSIQY